MVKKKTNKKKTIVNTSSMVPEGMIRMNVNLPKDFHKQIKQRALDEDISVTTLVKIALEEYLEK